MLLEIEAVRLLVHAVVDLILPVGVGGGEVGVSGHEFLKHGSLAVAVEDMGGSDVGVARSSPVGDAPLLGVEHFVAFGYGAGAGGIVDVDCHAVAFTLLGGDDNDTVGSTGTIDRSGGGVFEHLHCLDVGGVDAVDVVGGHTVDDVEGSLLELAVDMPRTLIEPVPPGAASGTTFTPGSLPAREFMMLPEFSLRGSFMFITATAPVRSAFLTVR